MLGSANDLVTLGDGKSVRQRAYEALEPARPLTQNHRTSDAGCAIFRDGCVAAVSTG